MGKALEVSCIFRKTVPVRLVLERLKLGILYRFEQVTMLRQGHYT